MLMDTCFIVPDQSHMWSVFIDACIVSVPWRLVPYSCLRLQIIAYIFVMGESVAGGRLRIWRIMPYARYQQCGRSADCHISMTLFAIWSWLSRLCGNFSHDVPPQAWHHPPRAQVCMQGCIRCCVESLNMDLGQAQKWSQLMSSGTSQEWFWG